MGKFVGVMSGLSLGKRMSNLKSVALTVLELLAFNSHDRPLRTHKQTHKHTHNDKHTHIERTHFSAIHFVHLAEIKRNCYGLSAGQLTTVCHEGKRGHVTAELQLKVIYRPTLHTDINYILQLFKLCAISRCYHYKNSMQLSFWPTVFGRAFATGCRLSVCL